MGFWHNQLSGPTDPADPTADPPDPADAAAAAARAARLRADAEAVLAEIGLP